MTTPRPAGRPAVLAVVALGGLLGASARHVLAQALPVDAGGVPWATAAANASGSLALGAVLGVLARRPPRHAVLRPFLTSGVLGGFTTMSTLQVETVLLVAGGHGPTAAAYAASSAVGGPVLAGLGLAIGRHRRGGAAPPAPPTRPSPAASPGRCR